MNILIAPNAFKNSLDAATAAQAIRQGLEASRLACNCECFPIGDGGDGTGRLLVGIRKGRFFETAASDPFGRRITASYGLIDDGRTAVVEMAEASGIGLLQEAELNPLKATSHGTGELIKAALGHPVDRVVIALGGSATVDGGAGILRALGVRFINGRGDEITDLPAGLIELNSVDLSDLDPRLSKSNIVLLCDVKNKLLGEEGAAAVFGPQKGASKEDVSLLDAALSRLRDVALTMTGKDMAEISGGGAAGGAAAGLWAFLDATLADGIGYYLELSGFQEALKKADLVITGEGSIDVQTLNGKGPYGVAVMAKKEGIPVIGLAGKVPLVDSQDLRSCFDVLLPIGNEPTGIDNALSNTYQNLIRTSFNIGNLLSLS